MATEHGKRQSGQQAYTAIMCQTLPQHSDQHAIQSVEGKIDGMIARRFYAPDRPWGKVVGMAREYDLSRRAIYDIIERVMPLSEPRLPGPVPCVKQLLPCAEAQDSVPCGVMLSPPTAETKTLSFIQQRGIDLAGRAVLKAFAVENLTHLDLLLLAQSPWS